MSYCAFLFQFENEENERRRHHEERLKEKHRHSIQNLQNKQQVTRNELLLVQVKTKISYYIKFLYVFIFFVNSINVRDKN